jgi:surface carbohydrate biosynthesis protein
MLKKILKISLINFLKNFYFYIFDFLIFFLGLNIKNKNIKNKYKIIWLAETGSRDFLPRLAQAIALWEEFSISSIVIHKHMLRQIDKRFFKGAIVIDKSATFNCIRRLRYSKINGALNIVIPEELLICDKSKIQIKGSLNPRTLNYVDYVVTNSNEVKDYLKNVNKFVKIIDVLNPRLSSKVIKKNCENYFINKKSFSKLIDEEFILINDKLSLKFTSLDNELEVIKNSIFNFTDIDPSGYLNNYLIKEEQDEKLLINFIIQLRKNKTFNKFKILIRPHPSVDVNKYKNYFKEKLDESLNYFILREGSALDWMNEARIIFHNNCTTAIEGFYNGLENIFNYSNNLDSGTSEEFKTILEPLGIENSILKADEFIKNNNHSERKKNTIKEKIHLYQFLGKEMVNNKVIKSKTDIFLANLKNASISESSPLQRWEDALDKIRYIEENRDKFKKLCVFPLGRVGAQVGN